MNDYEARKQARIERLKDRATLAGQEADRHFERAHDAVAMIPLGQPVLIGHHSERRHRAALGRMETQMRCGVEAVQKADHYAERARAAEKNAAISSDDPDAIVKLERKLASLQLTRECRRSANALIRKKGLQAALPELPEAVREELLQKLELARGHEKYVRYDLANIGAEIRRVEERIESLQKADARPTTEETVNGVRIVDNAEANRVQLFFDGKPDKAVRDALKAAGFRWAPSESAWQAYRSSRALTRAREIVGGAV